MDLGSFIQLHLWGLSFRLFYSFEGHNIKNLDRRKKDSIPSQWLQIPIAIRKEKRDDKRTTSGTRFNSYIPFNYDIESKSKT